MKYKFLILVLVVPLLASNALAAAQDFPAHLYEPNTLRNVIKENTSDATKYKDTGQLVLTKGRPYRVSVKYTGTSRPISANRKELLKLWIESYGIESRFFELYENEFLFTEDDVEYWLPVQTPVAKYFDKELTKGDRLDVYVQFVGGKRGKGSDHIDWMFLVNEYQKQQAN
ncbi:MAG: hypothetical protein WCD76_18965 [Pyrinomonadaceae bacterium]